MKTTISTIVCAALLVIVVGCKPALNQKNASRLIPDGMSEARVYELLGSNNVIRVERQGRKNLEYIFMFTGYPPVLKTELPAITIVLSNGVVIERIFPEMH